MVNYNEPKNKTLDFIMIINFVSALFHLAHKLVDLYPDMALAWFGVGCYYYSIGTTSLNNQLN